MGVIYPEIESGDYAMETIYNNAIVGGCAYLKANPAVQSLVMGISGGIDSFITAVLARAVIDKMNDRTDDRPYRLVGYSLPILTNKDDEMLRARTTGEALCTNFAEVNLDKQFMDLVQGIDNSLFYEMYGHGANQPLDSKIRAGNVKARMRMMYLYDKANKYNGMVLSTDNYTEYLLGFWTLHGDVGDFGFIQELWKTEVYNLADWLIAKGMYSELAEDAVGATPTDGLGISNSDIDQLLPGWSEGSRAGYEFIDKMLLNWQKGECEDPDHPVIQRMFRSEFKRNNPANLDRLQLIGLIG